MSQEIDGETKERDGKPKTITRNSERRQSAVCRNLVSTFQDTTVDLDAQEEEKFAPYEKGDDIDWRIALTNSREKRQN
jgi:hypothetical protein